ncbi:phasin [Methylobacterium nigriterrae]|uniref:phasin n=1 Tax=Methylobacterium nigriterrae TaxID=3127512 RepID=UPI003013A832
MSTTQPSFEIPAEMRDFAEKSVEQARSALTSFIQNARKAADSLQTSTKTAELPASVAFSRGLAFTEQNVTAAFDLAQKLVRARDVQEAVQLQSDYVRTQFAALQTQAKELTSAVQPNKA